MKLFIVRSHNFNEPPSSQMESKPSTMQTNPYLKASITNNLEFGVEASDEETHLQVLTELESSTAKEHSGDKFFSGLKKNARNHIRTLNSLTSDVTMISASRMEGPTTNVNEEKGSGGHPWAKSRKMGSRETGPELYECPYFNYPFTHLNKAIKHPGSTCQYLELFDQITKKEDKGEPCTILEDEVVVGVKLNKTPPIIFMGSQTTLKFLSEKNVPSIRLWLIAWEKTSSLRTSLFQAADIDRDYDNNIYLHIN